MSSLLSVFDASVISLPCIQFRAGNISPIENNIHLPFEIKRVFYLYDIPGGESRGAHAHKECFQFLIPASGSFEVQMDDGTCKRQVFLNRPYHGLLIPPSIWASELNFSSGSVCLVLASHTYDPADYIRDYQEFTKYRKLKS
jgi:hypothetical protein